VKSSAPPAVAGVLGCILIAGCVQTREANVASPPATSYQVGSFELQESGSSQKVRGASVTPVFFRVRKFRLCSAVVSFRRNTARARSRLSWSVTVSGKSDFVGTHE